jgi:hypothetical protein
MAVSLPPPRDTGSGSIGGTGIERVPTSQHPIGFVTVIIIIAGKCCRLKGDAVTP